MSNQTKFGLILGLGVILLVGIIVSDHLSQTKQCEITDNAPVLAMHGEQNPGNMPDRIREEFLFPAPVSGAEAAMGNPAIRPPLVPVIAVNAQPIQTASIPAENTPRGAAIPGIPVMPAPGGVAIQAVPPVAPQPAHPTRTYTVKAGDNLSVIAAKTLGSRNRWNEILAANKQALDAAHNKLSIGMLLNVPADTAAAFPGTPPSPLAASRTYVVQKGDLLGSIAARQLGSSKRVKDLVDANKKALPKGEKSLLNVGMTLVIPAQ